MKIIHDPTRCASLGICEDLAPGLFEVTDDGELVVLQQYPAAAQEANARAAAAACPTGAITLATD